MKEINFSSLKNNFETISDQVNKNHETVTVSLKSGRKVYVMPEENYDQIQRFIIPRCSLNTLTSF